MQSGLHSHGVRLTPQVSYGERKPLYSQLSPVAAVWSVCLLFVSLISGIGIVGSDAQLVLAVPLGEEPEGPQG